jgi:hypothetical protein
MGPVDVAVAVATYNHARTLPAVLAAVRAGLAADLPGAKAMLVASDAHSADGTPDLVPREAGGLPHLVLAHDAPPAERLAPPFHGVPGLGLAQLTLLEAARTLRARACAFLAADCTTVAPEWIGRLVQPVLRDGRDYVVPAYRRHRYDGTLTQTLLYPLVRALAGRPVRHLLTGQAGLSDRLVEAVVGHPPPGGDPLRHGLDLWLALSTAAPEVSVAEAWLGPYGTDPEPRRPDLATTFAQAVGTAFGAIEATADTWLAGRPGLPLPAAEGSREPDTTPRELDTDAWIRAFRRGTRDLLPLWEQVLAPETLSDLLAAGAAGDREPALGHDLWAQVACDFALGYRFRILHRDHLLRALVPLYLGRVATFVRATAAGGAAGTERWVEEGCRAFERARPYLVERWR